MNAPRPEALARSRMAPRRELLRTVRLGALLALLASVASIGVLFSSSGPTAHAADAPPPPSAPPAAGSPSAAPSGDVELDLRSGIAVPDLLRLVSGVAEVPILWSDQDKVVTTRKLQGSLSVHVPRIALFDAVRDLLASQEIVFVPIGAAAHPIWYAMDARTLQNQFILKSRPEHVTMDDAEAVRLEGRTGLFIETTLHMPGAEPAELRDIRVALARIVTGQNVGSV